MRRNDADGSEDSLEEKKTDEKEVVQSLVERISYLSGLWLGRRRWQSRRRLNTLDWVKSPGSGPLQNKILKKKNCPGSVRNGMKTQRRAAFYQDSLCLTMAEEKMRHRDRQLETDPSSGTYNLDQQEVCGGEEIEKIAVSRKPFRELSCNPNFRTNLVPEDDRKVSRRIVCVKLKDYIQQSWRNEWSENGTEGTRQGKI